MKCIICGDRSNSKYCKFCDPKNEDYTDDLDNRYKEKKRDLNIKKSRKQKERDGWEIEELE